MRRWRRTSLNSSSANKSDKKTQIRMKTVQQTSSPSSTYGAQSVAIEIKSLSAKKSPLLESIKIKLEEQISLMLEKIKRIVQWQGVDLKTAMNYVRSSVLFKQIDGIDTKVVDDIVGEYANNKISFLKSSLAEKDQQLKDLKEEIKDERQFSEIKLRPNSIFINPKTDNVMYQLFKKAQENSFEDFMIIYNKIHSHSPPFLKPKVKNTENQSTSEGIKFKMSFHDYIKPLVQKMEEQEKIYFQKLINEELKCNRPCCKWGPQEHSIPNPAQLYLTCQSPSSKSQWIYHNSQFNEYCNRYCGKSFKLSNVVSITRTHAEQMDKIYSRFKHKQKQKVQQHVRNKSVV